MSDDPDFGEEESTPFQKLSLDGDDAAIQAVKGEIAKDPNNAALHAKLGKLLIEHDDYDGGVKAYNAAIKLNPNEISYYTQKAHSQLEANETEDAISVLNAALAISPGDADANYELGRAYQATGNKKEASKYFNIATEKNPKHARAWLEVAAALLNESDSKEKEKHQDEALKIYKKVIELEPNNSSAYYAAGQILQLRNKEADIKEASALFNKVVSLDQKDGHARARLIQCYDALNLEKEREEAREAFHKAFDSGKLSEAYRKLGRYCCAQFEVGDFFVIGYDHLSQDAANVKYAFLVHKKGEVSEDKILYRITLTRAADSSFHLETIHTKDRHSYVVYKSAPTYQQVKNDATKIVRGESQPIAH